jgi:hypothetical protein
MDKRIRIVVKTKKDYVDYLQTRFFEIYGVDVIAGTNKGSGNSKRNYIKLIVPEYSGVDFDVTESNGGKELEICIDGANECEEFIQSLQFALDAIKSIEDDEVIEPEI